MRFVITFLEGVISFISPCMLPMLPVYISYFAGGSNEKGRIFLRSLCFVLGFTVTFSSLGLFAGSLGALLSRHQAVVNVLTGAIVVLFGLSYLDVIKLPFFKGMDSGRKITGVFSAFLFGIVYSISLTPCVGAFLGSALMLASSSATALTGLLLLVSYSLGLGLPFIISALLIEQLNSAFRFIKRNYRLINLICGIFLIAVGILMALGLLNTLLALFS